MIYSGSAGGQNGPSAGGASVAFMSRRFNRLILFVGIPLACFILFLISGIHRGREIPSSGGLEHVEPDAKPPTPPSPDPVAQPPKQHPPPTPAPPPKPEPPKDDPELDYWTWKTTTSFRPVVGSKTHNETDFCAGFPTELLSRIQVVLKIGAAEDKKRLDTVTSSVVKCFTNLLVYSDMEHEVGDFHAHDILADLPLSYADHPDFKAYYKQKELFEKGRLHEGTEGWRLDRFKFLPQIEKAYEVNPSAEWFVFLESDTYVVWDNVFRLLEHYDPTEVLYMGSPSPGRDQKPGGPKVWFAYGGAGYVLSNAAVKQLLSRKVGEHGEYIEAPLTREFEKDIKGDCCGDSILGWALFKKNVTISGLWPMFNPHPMRGVPFGKHYWCQPVISMHKTFPEEMVDLWEWEQKQSRERPLLYADLLHYLSLGTFSFRKNWDNADFDGWQEPRDHPAHESKEACSQMCNEHDACFQYTYHIDTCTFVRSIRLGQAKEPEGKAKEILKDKAFYAGWDTLKIKRWLKERPCEDAIWVKPSLKRIF